MDREPIGEDTMKASELRDLIDKRIREHGDMDVRFDGDNVEDVKYMHHYFVNEWLEIMT